MNWLIGVVVVLVVVTMFSGGKIEKVPAKLKSSAKSLTSGNKMLVGVLIGVGLCWAYGQFRVEGLCIRGHAGPPHVHHVRGWSAGGREAARKEKFAAFDALVERTEENQNS